MKSEAEIQWLFEQLAIVVGQGVEELGGVQEFVSTRDGQVLQGAVAAIDWVLTGGTDDENGSKNPVAEFVDRMKEQQAFRNN